MNASLLCHFFYRNAGSPIETLLGLEMLFSDGCILVYAAALTAATCRSLARLTTAGTSMQRATLCVKHKL